MVLSSGWRRIILVLISRLIKWRLIHFFFLIGKKGREKDKKKDKKVILRVNYAFFILCFNRGYKTENIPR
jgi:hypothetical protein